MPRNEEINNRLVERAIDFTDVIALAHPEAAGFKVASTDNKHGIKMLTKPVEESPIHLMKAESLMPCPPAEFLRYLDTEIRAMWDENIYSSQVIRNLDVKVAPKKNKNGGGEIASSTLLKHMEFKSPLPQFFRNRDFEIVVHEQLDKETGVGLLKAFSTPRAYLKPVTMKEESATKNASRAVAASVGKWLGIRSGTGAPSSGASSSSSTSGAGGSTVGGSGSGSVDITTEAVVRGSIVMSGFVLVPLLQLDNGTIVEDRRGLEEVGPDGKVRFGKVRRLEAIPPIFEALVALRQKTRVLAQLDPSEYLTLATLEGDHDPSSPTPPPTKQYRVVGSKVVYIALVQPMGRIPPMLVNLVIGKQTSGLKYLQRFIAKNPLSTLPQSKDGSSSARDAAASSRVGRATSKL